MTPPPHKKKATEKTNIKQNKLLESLFLKVTEVSVGCSSLLILQALNKQTTKLCLQNFKKCFIQAIFYKNFKDMRANSVDHENVFETGVVRANDCYSLHRVRKHNKDIFSIFFNMMVCCVFSLESPHRGDINEDTQHTIIDIK